MSDVDAALAQLDGLDQARNDAVLAATINRARAVEAKAANELAIAAADDTIGALTTLAERSQAVRSAVLADPPPIPPPPPGPEPPDPWDPPSTAARIAPAHGSVIPADKPYIVRSGTYLRVRVAAGGRVWFEPNTVMDGEATDAAGQDFTLGSALLAALGDGVLITRYGDNGDTDNGGSVGNAAYTMEVARLTISRTQGACLVLGPSSVVEDVIVTGGERYGWKAFGAGARVKGLVAFDNNTKHYDPTNDAGACKLLWSDFELVDYLAYNNYGNGLWMDGAGGGGLVDGAVLENNSRFGVSHELSKRCLYRNLRIDAQSGLGAFQLKTGEAILESSKCKGYVVAEDDHRGKLGVFEVNDCDLEPRENPHAGSWGFGMRTVPTSDLIAYSQVKYGGRAQNRYKLATPDGRYFRAVFQATNKPTLTFAQWQATGQDVNAILV